MASLGQMISAQSVQTRIHFCFILRRVAHTLCDSYYSQYSPSTTPSQMWPCAAIDSGSPFPAATPSSPAQRRSNLTISPQASGSNIAQLSAQLSPSSTPAQTCAVSPARTEFIEAQPLHSADQKVADARRDIQPSQSHGQMRRSHRLDDAKRASRNSLETYGQEEEADTIMEKLAKQNVDTDEEDTYVPDDGSPDPDDQIKASTAALVVGKRDRNALKEGPMALDGHDIDREALLARLTQLAEKPGSVPSLLGFVLCDLLGPKAVDRVRVMHEDYTKTTASADMVQQAAKTEGSKDTKAFAGKFNKISSIARVLSPSSTCTHLQRKSYEHYMRLLELHEHLTAVALLISDEDPPTMAYLEKVKRNAKMSKNTRSGRSPLHEFYDLVAQLTQNQDLKAFTTMRRNAEAAHILVKHYGHGILAIFHPPTRLRA